LLADVVTDYTQPDARFDLATGSGATLYAGLDRFDRIATAFWQKYSGTPADLVKLGYTYDRLSNRLTRDDHVAKAQMTPQYFDELYTYDQANRLIDLKRGQLSGGSITGQTFRQNWETTTSPETAIDPTGNWTRFNQDDNGDGTWELVQSRTHNPVNEITAIGETTGPVWRDPAYDAAGNTTTMPIPIGPTNQFRGTYDAGNRLVQLKFGTGNTIIAGYAYDGLHRRAIKLIYTAGVHTVLQTWIQ